MKKTQVKDSIRNIRKQIVSYLSILVISMLAVLTFLGINYSAEAIRANSSKFYADTNFRDVEIVSTYLITPDDLEAIRADEGVEDVEGVYRTGCRVYGDDGITGVMVVSLTERINVPLVVEGRLPQNENECVIEPEVSSSTGLDIGDTISVLNSHHVMPEYLNRCDYVITGIVRHPDHSCVSNISPGARYVMVLPEAFDSEALDGCYMAAVASIAGADQFRMMDDEYHNYISDTVNRLNGLADERAIIRYNEVRNAASDRIDEGQDQIDEAGEELQESRDELDQRWQEYYDGVAQLNDAEQELSEAEAQLADARNRLSEGGLQLEEGRAQLESVEAQLAEARARLDSTRAQLDSGWAQLEEGRQRLDAYAVQIEQGRIQLNDAQTQLEAARLRLQQAQSELELGRQGLIAGYAQIEDSKTVIRNNLRQAIVDVLGEDIANRIDWSESSYVIDPDDPQASAQLLHITNGITIDLQRSLGDNIFAVISSLGIPEDELRAAYERATGRIIEIIDGRPVLQFIVDVIVESYNVIDNRYNDYASYARLWDEQHGQYIAALNLYNQGMAAYNAALEQFNAGQSAFDAGLAQYNEGIAQYNDGLAQYYAARDQYLAGEDEYAAGLAEYNARLAELAQAEAQYEEGQIQYQEGLEQYQEGLEQYQQGQEDLAEGLDLLNEGEEAYDEGLAQYEEGQARLQDAMDDLEKLNQCHWNLLTPEGNAGFFQIRTDARNVSDMGGTFALVFILVGALVIYATVGRIIDEQRNLVGVSKALGMYNREIFMKYLSFGVTATVIGSILGIVLGYFFIQSIYLTLYGENYTFNMDHHSIIIWLTAVVFVAGLALSSVTVWFACSTLMRSSAITLMQDRVPDIKRSKKKSGRGKGSLYSNMILLNMLSDKKRVLVTIVSIAGSCTLLVTGMALNFSINNSIDAQFNDVEVYDLKITYDLNISGRVQDQIERVLQEQGLSYLPVSSSFTSYDSNGKLGVFELLTTDFGSIDQYIERHDINTNEIYTGAGSGIWIFQRLAETLDIGAGDTLTLYDSSLNPHEVSIAGVFTEYVGQQVLMSNELYEEVFNETPQYNTLLVNQNGSDCTEAVERISGLNGFISSRDTVERYNHAKALSSVLDYISALFVAAAGLMAYFILLNLVNMYVHQKTHELTIMRINGFTVGETIRYVSLELIVSTVLGIILGLGLGSLLSYRVVCLLESLSLHIIRDIQFKAWGYAAFITVIFATLVSAWALRKVRRLKLTDINNE